MGKPLASRIIVLAVIYIAVFCIIVIIQFSKSGYFTIEAGEMTIRGRYLQDVKLSAAETEYLSLEFPQEQVNPVAGGIKIFYAGLEFSLTEDRAKGLILKDSGGAVIPANPELMLITKDSARFIMPTGTILTFIRSETSRGPQLQISANLPENISEVVIPIFPRRSSVVSDSGQLGIMYGGLRYVFSSLGDELENENIVLTSNIPSIAYYSRSGHMAFDPADFIVTGEQDYDNNIRSWQDQIYTKLNQNRSMLINEDNITAFLSQSIRRGDYAAALRAIPAGFTSSMRTFRSSTYLGGMANAYRQFVAAETEKLNLITRLVNERSLDLLNDGHILDYLFSRNNTPLANEVIRVIRGISKETLTVNYIPGLLEFYQDIRQWLPSAGNPINHLSQDIIELLSESLSRDHERDLTLVHDSEGINLEYNMRLGLALVYWADAENNPEWASIGRSLVLSAIKDGDDGRLFNIFRTAEYYPRAVLLNNDGLWAWTIARTINAANIDSDINLSFTFPANVSHHVIIRGVRPFINIQIHGQTWRSASDFETYDSSGWVYYAAEQILVLKLRHRETLENVRLVYRTPPPPPAPAPSPAPAPVTPAVPNNDESE